ncbi:EamA family transporter RarD [Gorillibacterium sp. sgz5001074]|uniref:EamA family transporter RarD n=1 Tax=Gorillibacterium sp. sgz5001074 TaxID=3446695 RepID=UPI003F681058
MNKGLPYALLAYLAWGFLPLYWKALDEVPAWEILGHRVVWSTVFLMGMLAVTRQFGAWRTAIRDGKTFRLVLVSSLMISVNWLVFIWAVNNGHMVETSLGYYMNPLLNVLLGVVLLKERLHAGQWAAIALALGGVAVVTVEYGRLPWISLVLAGTFALYGFFKKKTRMDSTTGLAWETVLVTPIAAGYLLYVQAGGHAGTGELGLLGWVLLLLAGVATVLPLYWFAQAARHLPLSTIGFIQYIGPTITLGIGVWVYHESFDTARWISFGLIWAALVVYTIASVRHSARSQQKDAHQAA